MGMAEACPTSTRMGARQGPMPTAFPELARETRRPMGMTAPRVIPRPPNRTLFENAEVAFQRFAGCCALAEYGQRGGGLPDANQIELLQVA